jgi:hypothetical protein
MEGLGGGEAQGVADSQKTLFSFDSLIRFGPVNVPRSNNSSRRTMKTIHGCVASCWLFGFPPRFGYLGLFYGSYGFDVANYIIKVDRIGHKKKSRIFFRHFRCSKSRCIYINLNMYICKQGTSHPNFIDRNYIKPKSNFLCDETRTNSSATNYLVTLLQISLRLNLAPVCLDDVITPWRHALWWRTSATRNVLEKMTNMFQNHPIYLYKAL